LGISNSGVVGDYSDNTGAHSFIYNNGTFTTISAASGANTYVQGINDSGQVAEYYTDITGTNHGFIDNNGTFRTIDNPNAVRGTSIFGINNSGQLVGYYVNSSYKTISFTATEQLGAPEPLNILGVTTVLILFRTYSKVLKRRKLSK
jgi:uncharacterized membrane protein